ncbi:hypothetical protein ADK67_17455 [Saccharothrix sp. NRRL B-16348]|uniref:DUF397 domain-containing protein n=1 Tax=Saccharothrix sp. NRRL B-16348 TaxID=1415542 RepID=UPI0006B01A84|nr:DUF397 domain-containing protein [Saccharothrix sp. NRRL B-16348]KOX24770.1 hypothetical protein ADK67_17455 [Saccharothrix sp. NRRL B-16348]
MPDQRGQWRKSTYSSTQPDCVELSVTSEATAVRDSKLPAAGELRFPRERFQAFLAALKSE